MKSFSKTYAFLLRISALAVRSFFVIALAVFLTPSEVGVYGLVASLTTMLVLVVGLDFYTFANREIVSPDPARRRVVLSTQFFLALIAYLIILPGSYVLVSLGVITQQMWFWLILLIPSEHLGTEANRFLIATGDFLKASVALFIRQALSPVISLLLMALSPEARSVSTVFASWIVFSIISLVYSVFVIRHKTQWRFALGGVYLTFKKGLKPSLLFLIGTVCLTSLFTVDRQFVALSGDAEILGAYVFFMTIGLGINSVLAAGVFQFLYPHLIESVTAKSQVSYRSTLRKLMIHTTALLIAVISVLGIVIKPVLNVLESSIYLDNLNMLFFVVCIMIIYNASLIPHYCLYAFKADYVNMWATVSAALAFFLIALILPCPSPITPVLTGLLVSVCILFITKTIAARQISARFWNENH